MAKKKKQSSEKIAQRASEKVTTEEKSEVISQKSEEQKQIESTLNLIYGSVAILVVLVIVLLLFFLNINKPSSSVGVQQANNTIDNNNVGQITVTTGSLPPLGSPDAPVTMIVFDDYQCPFCAKLYNNVEKKIREEYVSKGKAKLYVRDLPLQQLHDKAFDVAIAARCANEQGKFWEMHDRIFERQSEWSLLPLSSALEKIKGYATELGLDVIKFSDCVKTRKYENAVNADFNDFVTKYGSPATPTVLILLPKNKVTNTAALQNLGVSYVSVSQDANNYLVVVMGAAPYNIFKTILDSVNY
jgi:protein-disulfide isomerase